MENKDYDHDEEKHRDILGAFQRSRKDYRGPRGKLLGIQVHRTKEDKEGGK